MPQLETVDFGPFGGYQSAQEPHLAPADRIVGNIGGDTTTLSSVDMLLDPLSGFWYRRKGCLNQFDTLDGSDHEVTGLLESGMSWSARTRKLFSLNNRTLGTSTPAILYGNTNSTSFPTVDTGYFGTLWCRHIAKSSNYNLLNDWTGRYPTDPNSAFSIASNGLMVSPPKWVETSGTGLYTRGETAFTRRMLTAGSYGAVDAGNWLVFPCQNATPAIWDKTMNGSGETNVVRFIPSGPFPPFPNSNITDGNIISGGSWQDGDTFFWSYAFQFEDGSWSAPTIPRPTNSILGSGLNLHTVGTPGGTNTYDSVVHNNVPRGPAGTVRVAILRSPKQTRTASTDAISVSPLDLRLVGVMPIDRSNATSATVFTDSDGSENGLVENDQLVRFDTVVPRRARHIGTGDQRVIIADTLQSPHAITLTVVEITASGDVNVTDDHNAGIGTKSAFYRVTSSTLELYTFDTSGVGGQKLLLQQSIDLTMVTTVQALVDTINATGRSASPFHVAWRAQIAPGVDAFAPTSGLCPTVQVVNNCQTTGSSAILTTSGSFADVPVGAMIYEVAGTSITAGTYVVSKQSNTQLTMSAPMTVPATKNLTFYSWCGDGLSFQTTTDFRTTIATPSTLTLGLIRAFSVGYPSFVYFKRSALINYNKRDRSKVYYTVGSPGAANIGASLAINTWGADNELAPTIANAGPILGIVDIEGAAVVGYQNGIALFQNIKGVNSGEDFDYKLFTINSRRGIASWSAILGGNGWACYATREGVFATDRNRREFNIGKDIYNAGRNQGDLTNELKLSLIATDADTDDSHLYLSLLRGRIALSYRDLNGTYSTLFYDYTPGIDASGVEELADADRKAAYGWSAPCQYNMVHGRGFGLYALVPTSSGLLTYGAYDGAYSSTNDGRIDLIDNDDNDNTTSFSGTAYLPLFSSPAFAQISCQDLSVLHKTPSGNTTATQITTSHDQLFSSTNTYGLLNTGTDYFKQQILELVQADRGPVAVLWMRYTDSSINAQGDGFWKISARYQVLPR